MCRYIFHFIYGSNVLSVCLGVFLYSLFMSFTFFNPFVLMLNQTYDRCIYNHHLKPYNWHSSHWQRRLGLTTVCAFKPHLYYKSKDIKHLKVIINTGKKVTKVLNKLLCGSVAQGRGWLVVWGWLILCVMYSESFLCAVLIMVHNGFRSEKVIKAMWRWVGLLAHCQVWSWLTQTVGRAEPEGCRQSVHVGGAGAGPDLVAGSTFLLTRRGVDAGLRVVPGSPHMWWVMQWMRYQGWVLDGRALNLTLKRPSSRVSRKVLNPAVMRGIVLGGVYILPKISPYFCYSSWVFVQCLPGVLPRGPVQVLSYGIIEWPPSEMESPDLRNLWLSRAPGSCSVIKHFGLRRLSYSFNTYVMGPTRHQEVV